MSNHILELLQIMDLAKQWPQFQAIHDVAREDLLKANEEAKAEIAKRAEARAKKEAAEKAEAAAKAKAIVDAQTKKDEQDKATAERAAARTESERERTTTASVVEPRPEATVERRE